MLYNMISVTEGGIAMPHWLRNQLMRAFLRGDARKVRLLNDCWYFYRAQAIHMKANLENDHTVH